MELRNDAPIPRPAVPRPFLHRVLSPKATLPTIALAGLVAVAGLGPLGQLASSLSPKATLTVDPDAGAAGTVVQVRGASLPARTELVVAWDGLTGGLPPVETDAAGSFTASVAVPSFSTGTHTVSVVRVGGPEATLGSAATASALASAPFTITAVGLSGLDSSTTDPATAPTGNSPTDAATDVPGTPDATPTEEAPPTDNPTAGPPPTPEPTAEPTPTDEPSPTDNPTPRPTPRPTPKPTPKPTPTPTPDPSGPPSGSDYTFDSEFNGSSIGSDWLRHFHCCGDVAGYDPSLTTVSGGYLRMSVAQESGGWYTDLIDTKTTFTQKYGYFEARIKIPKGHGLWPAFWSYASSPESEIDTVEVCANPIGTAGGNDASQLHTTIHWSGGGSQGKATNTVDLSQAFHTYGVDWRKDYINFYLDGDLVWTFTDTAHIPQIALPVILNLGIGGTWCGAPDASDNGATMLVDWVRVLP